MRWWLAIPHAWLERLFLRIRRRPVLAMTAAAVAVAGELAAIVWSRR